MPLAREVSLPGIAAPADPRSSNSRGIPSARIASACCHGSVTTTADGVSDAEIDELERAAHHRTHRFRSWLARRHPAIRIAYRVLIALLGTVVIVIGLIIVPLPGPGWLIVFGGLAILATEFAWAKRLARWLKRQLATAWAWWKRVRARRRDAKAARQRS